MLENSRCELSLTERVERTQVWRIFRSMALFVIASLLYCNLGSNISDWLSSVLKSADPAKIIPEMFGLSLLMNI